MPRLLVNFLQAWLKLATRWHQRFAAELTSFSRKRAGADSEKAYGEQGLVGLTRYISHLFTLLLKTHQFDEDFQRFRKSVRRRGTEKFATQSWCITDVPCMAKFYPAFYWR